MIIAKFNQPSKKLVSLQDLQSEINQLKIEIKQIKNQFVQLHADKDESPLSEQNFLETISRISIQR